MDAKEWVPFVTTGIMLLSMVLNGVIAFSIRSWTARIEKLEEADLRMSARVNALEVATARDSATRTEIGRIHDHLKQQDGILGDIRVSVAKMVPGHYQFQQQGGMQS